VERPVPERKLKVLVIDDDNSVADTLVMVLNFSGFEAIAAYSGEHALDLARMEPCDHLVTDVMMEPMNGIQAAIAIQAICPDCTVLLMSGNERTSQLLVDAVRDGYQFDILPKPVHPTVILDRLRAAPTGSASA
jgi:DNA-binding NtrC family response regulator